MNDLLVGCEVMYDNAKYVVLRTKSTENNSYAWCMNLNNGEIEVLRVVNLTISPVDMKRIVAVNKYINRYREKAFKTVTRAELMDFD